MFADDTCLYHQSSDISLLNEAINKDLTHVHNWLKGNKLSLNVMKTYSMLICTKPKPKALKSKKIHVDKLEVVRDNFSIVFAQGRWLFSYSIAFLPHARGNMLLYCLLDSASRLPATSPVQKQQC